MGEMRNAYDILVGKSVGKIHGMMIMVMIE
jgi:hypothetical protein